MLFRSTQHCFPVTIMVADLVSRLVKLNLGADRIELMVKLLENSMYEIERNGNVKMILLDASYRLSHLIRKTA